MCIQSVGEKKCTQCNLSGPAIIINDGNFWRNHAKLLQQQVFRLFLATKDSSFGIHRRKPKWNIRPSFRSLLMPKKTFFKSGFQLETETSAALFALLGVDLVGFFHAVAGHHLAAKCRPCQGVSSSSGFGIFCAQASSFRTAKRARREQAELAVTLQLFGGLDLMSSLFVSVLLLPGKS